MILAQNDFDWRATISWARRVLRGRRGTSVWSRQRKAVIQFIVTHTERDHVASSRRGTLIVLGVEDRRMLSLWWCRGKRALSRRELACHRLLKSSTPLFFPHRSLGGRKWEGARGGVALWKEKNRVCKLVAARGPNPAAWDVSTADPGISEESAKKGVRRWREEIWDAVAGCIAIGSLFNPTRTNHVQL